MKNQNENQAIVLIKSLNLPARVSLFTEVDFGLNLYQLTHKGEIVKNGRFQSWEEDQVLTVEQMEEALVESNFFVGGLNDEQILYYYRKQILGTIEILDF